MIGRSEAANGMNKIANGRPISKRWSMIGRSEAANGRNKIANGRPISRLLMRY